VPFTVPVPDEKRIDDLSNILLKEEASGILNWAIAGFREWQKNGLQQPKEVTDATEQYRTSEDIVRDFLEESYDVDPNQDWRVPRKDVYGEYARWSKESNLRPMSKKKFGSELQRLGVTGDAGARFWLGVKLRGVLAP
jgi:putative DNA primase/helicase